MWRLRRPMILWRPGGTGGIVPVWVWRLENKKNWLCKFQSKCRRDQCPSLKTERANSPFAIFCSIRVSSRLEMAHLRWGGQSTLLSLPLQMFISSRNTPIDTLRIVFKQVCGHSMAQSSWHLELIITAIISTTVLELGEKSPSVVEFVWGLKPHSLPFKSHYCLFLSVKLWSSCLISLAKLFIDICQIRAVFLRVAWQ